MQKSKIDDQETKDLETKGCNEYGEALLIVDISFGSRYLPFPGEDLRPYISPLRVGLPRNYITEHFFSLI